MTNVKATKRLFKVRDIYNTEKTDDLFARAVRENAVLQYENCPEYKEILDRSGLIPGASAPWRM